MYLHLWTFNELLIALVIPALTWIRCYIAYFHACGRTDAQGPDIGLLSALGLAACSLWLIISIEVTDQNALNRDAHQNPTDSSFESPFN